MLMSVEPVSLKTVDLDNCHREPIHVPGSVQPHGVLLAIDLSGRITHLSDRANRLLASVPALGSQLSMSSALWGCAPLRTAVTLMLEHAVLRDPVPPLAIEAVIAETRYDVVVHAQPAFVVLEFEPRESTAQDLSSFALLAHRNMARLKALPTIDAVMENAVHTMREMTGFDRVMAYRFHQDDSGEIVAEAKSAELLAFFGRRFPAADIPAQARRLYTINTLRLIADVHDRQLPILSIDAAAAPLDLSHSILRSVSPVHVEYLKNIEVAASMSMSLVVGGKLWGLIACHHTTAYRVPYALRMACDVLASVVSASVQTLLDKSAQARRAAANELRSALVELSLPSNESVARPGSTHAAIDRVVQSDRLVFSQGNDLRHDGLSSDAAIGLIRYLDAGTDDMVSLNELSDLPESLRTMLWPMCGLMAMRHDRASDGWLVLLRTEQAATVTWSGPPDKVTRIGPLGARLTPDGSLAEWQQEVRGFAEPWSDLDRSLARTILDELRRATASRAAEMDRARAHLLAILGHDLRDPLQSISVAAHLLLRGSDQVALGRRISASTERMSRLIAQVLDMSRLRGGMDLGLTFVPKDLGALVDELVAEATLAYPNLRIRTELANTVTAEIDVVRFAQVVANLLANARQHGVPGEEVSVRLTARDASAVLEITNPAPALDETLVKGLFDPLKRASVPNKRNSDGLGLGLYIASEAIKAHRGTLLYSHDGQRIVFTIVIPLTQAAAAA